MPVKTPESQARKLIDEQLRKVGWEVDTANLRHSKNVRPKPGHNMLIAEWPTDSTIKEGGHADYAMFLGEQLVGFIEAKAKYKNLPGVIDHQAKDYAKNVRRQDETHITGNWRGYQVPFIFAANGRKYLKDLEIDSGIWFQDLREGHNKPYALRGWLSPQAVADRLQSASSAANHTLATMSADFLTDPDGLNLRDYQLRAIQKTQEAIINGQERMLLAMATGTGKTRTVLGLIYKLLTANRFRRILFLVDRNSLGTQALDVFGDVRLEDLKTLKQIHNVQELEDKFIEPETSVQIATVQGMMRRILYCEETDRMPSAGDYDLVIVDEAHRGYTFDREMSEAEQLYRDERDFQSKYRQVIDYFDAVKIGLTATPALHTINIFGKPVYSYTYAEAVIDGWLVDHDSPHLLTTYLAKNGIHYDKGETVKQYDPDQHSINDNCLEDELDFAIDDFNKQVITENFNRAVLEEIARDIDPEDDKGGKTLIYAVNDRHADLIVDILKAIYARQGVDTDSIKKITGSIGDDKIKNEAIRQFRYEKFPSIAVTVDLLTTGIDVPAITRLVFIRRVKSRILFEQMLGRATRLCPEIGKTKFDIYDAVGIYDTLAPFSDMQPVAAAPGTTFAQLLDGIKQIDDEEQLSALIKQFAAKLQRRRRSMTPEMLEYFLKTTEKTPANFASGIAKMPVQEAKSLLLVHGQLFRLIDTEGFLPRKPLTISDKDDQLIGHERSYGQENQKPDDYLRSFAEFVKNNPDRITALNIICTRPKDLSRDDLKALLLVLKQKGYTVEQLNGAFSEMSNQDIAADIIGFIRSYALDLPLVGKEERIKTAIRKLKKTHSFTQRQKNWIDRFEKALLDEPILNVNDFDEIPAYKDEGGSARLDKIFDSRLTEIIDELNSYLYEAGGMAA